MNLTRIYDAESESLSLTDVKNHLRITSTDDDDALRDFIAAIRHKTETYLGRTLVTSTWELKLDGFSDQIELPMRPIQSFTSIQYVDTSGTTQTLAASGYQFDRQGRLQPSYGNSWPATREQLDAVTITYIAGEVHAGKVQQDIKLAMKLWIGACDVNRENVAFSQVSEIPNSARDLLAPYRVHRL